MKNLQRALFFLTFIFLFGIQGCKEDGGGFNIFSLEDDKALGLQLSDEIAGDPATYPVLSKTDYPVAYQHIERIRDEILNSGEVSHKDDFNWDIKIIRDDTMLNAFCAPGGYIYVYTGLIKYLDREDHLAGVIGHEIAHADLRHSTDQLTSSYTIQTLLDLILGENQGLLTQVAAGLLTLKFSRNHEAQADEYSVKYMCDTEYFADGAAGFFQKLLDDNNGNCELGAFLSTHPCPENRVQNIQNKKVEEGCTGDDAFNTRYTGFKNSLP